MPSYNRLWAFMNALAALSACGGDGFEEAPGLTAGQGGAPGGGGGRAGEGGVAAGKGGAGAGQAGLGGAGSGGAGSGGAGAPQAGAGQGGAGAGAGGAGQGGGGEGGAGAGGEGGKAGDGSCATAADCADGQACVPDPDKLFSKLHCAPNDGSHFNGCSAPVTGCTDGDCCAKQTQGGYVCARFCKEDWECPSGTVCGLANFKGSCGNYTTACRPELSL